MPVLASERSCDATVRSFSFVDEPERLRPAARTARCSAPTTAERPSAPARALPGTAAASASPAVAPTDIWFTSADATGFADAGGTLYRTTDGGNNWTQVHSGATALNALYARRR